MTTDLHRVQAAVPQFPSTVGTGSDPPGGCSTAIHDAPALVAAYSADTRGFNQVPIQAISKDIEDVEESVSNVKSIPVPVEHTVNAIGSANIAIGQLDAINSTYLQPLSIFNAVVTGIANVRVSKQRWSNLD